MLSFLLLGAAVLGGALVTCLFDDEADLLSRLAGGAMIGWTATCLVGYAAASFLGLGIPSVLIGLLFALAPLTLLRDPQVRARALDALRGLPSLGWALAGVLVLVAFATLMCARAFYVSPAGVCVGDFHNFGDLGFHLAITCDFVYGQRFPPEHPTFAGASLTYPFLMDFGAGMLVVSGSALQDAYLAESALLLVALLVLLHRFSRLLTGDSWAATLAVVLFVLSGGLGWWTFLEDARKSGQGFFTYLAHLPRDYTISPNPADGLRWGNTVTTLLLTQRTLLLGIGLNLLVFILWWQVVRDGRDVVYRRMVAAGCIAGLLPLAHAHSFLVVMGLGFCMGLLFMRQTGWKPWVLFAACAVAIGLPQILWIMANNKIKTSGFLAWDPGWDKPKDVPFLRFWFYNTGVFVPLLVISLAERDDKGWVVDRRVLRYYLPFALCFVLPNLLKMAPWIWDNIKVLVYWLLASVPFVAALLARQLRDKLPVRLLAVILIFMLTAAGAIDVWRVMSGQVDIVIIDRDGVAFAEQVRKITPPSALILHAAVANHPLVLSGRRQLLGYPGHVWSQGFDPGNRDAEIKSVYAGSGSATEILTKYNVGYIVVGPQERMNGMVNDSFLASMPNLLSVGPYTLYQVKITP